MTDVTDVTDVGDNPAARLRAMFNQMHAEGGTHTVTEWWEIIAARIAPGADAHSVRAEAATLFREVEASADLFGTDDDQEDYLFHRASCSQGVFSWGLNSRESNGTDTVYPAEKIVPAESVR